MSKLHILRMSVDTVPVATNHGGTARQCNPFGLACISIVHDATVRARPLCGLRGTCWQSSVIPTHQVGAHGGLVLVWSGQGGLHRCRRCRSSCGIGTVGAAHCVPNAEKAISCCADWLLATAAHHAPAALGKSLRLVRCQGGKARSHSSLSYSP